MGLLKRSPTGSGLLYHRGDRLQSGGSIGGLLARLFTKVAPLASKVAKAGLAGAKKFSKSQLAHQLKDTAINAATETAVNVLTGSDTPGEALKKGIETGLSDAKKQIAETIKSTREKSDIVKKPVKRKAATYNTKAKKKSKNKSYNLLQSSP